MEVNFDLDDFHFHRSGDMVLVILKNAMTGSLLLQNIWRKERLK